MSPTNDFVISSGAHLQTVWAGNTFLSKLAPGQFETPSGQWKSVQVMSSEPARYRHAKTDRFEAAVLPCNRAYLVVVLPALGKTVLDVEQDLVQDLEAVDSALKLQPGIIVMPPFRVLAELSLRKPLEGIGVTRIFQDLGGLVNIPRSRLTEVNQRTDIQVNRAGIKADAETVVGGIYGGIGPGVEESFRMELNRPFVFLVRDSITDALLFAGAVVDPTLQ